MSEVEPVPVEENKENVEPQALSLKEVEAVVEASEPSAEVAEPPAEEAKPAPKRKGRPVGAKTCEEKRGKPRAPRKPKIVEEPVEVIPAEPSREVPETRPRVIPNSRPIPDDNELMLELLRQQCNIRKNRKQALWKSWFA